MGAGLVIVFSAIVLMPIGLVFGLLFSFVGLPVFRWLRRVPAEKRKRSVRARLHAACLFAVVFVVVICGLGIYNSCKDQGNYWEYRGAFDFWRMPLEEPYELVMIDEVDYASISKWQNSRCIVSGIRRYEKRGPLIAGYRESRSSGSEDAGWFLFDCDTGHAEVFDAKQEFIDVCEKRGFSEPIRMRSIPQNWESYWKDPNRRRG